MRNNILTIASNVLFVKGHVKNLIIDLQNDCWYHVKFSLADDSEIKNLTKENLDFMLDQGMIFEIPERFKSNLKSFKLEYSSPNHLENVIMDRNANSSYSIEKSIMLLNRLRNKSLQVRWFDNINLTDLRTILCKTESSPCESIDILLPFDDFYQQVLDLKKQFPKISNVVFHSVNKSIDKHDLDRQEVFFTREHITDANNCGQVSPYNFSQNQSHVLKSINYNSCLYRKIGIDTEGNIKNCPSMKSTMGHISISDHLNIEDMESLFWTITKDEVDTCKDCEFRYICTDCRVFTEDSKRPYSKPSKCNYNPYLAKWEDEVDDESLVSKTYQETKNQV